MHGRGNVGPGSQGGSRLEGTKREFGDVVGERVARIIEHSASIKQGGPAALKGLGRENPMKSVIGQANSVILDGTVIRVFCRKRDDHLKKQEKKKGSWGKDHPEGAQKPRNEDWKEKRRLSIVDIWARPDGGAGGAH